MKKVQNFAYPKPTLGFSENIEKNKKQAGAELGQAQDKLKVIVDVGVEVQVKV